MKNIKKTKMSLVCLLVVVIMSVTACVPKTPEVSVTVDAVTLNKTTTSITVGSAETLIATVYYSNAETDNKVSWVSSDTSVVTVLDGVVTAVKGGEATITVASDSDSSKTALCQIVVTYQPAITISKQNVALMAGEKTTLSASVLLADGSESLDVIWSSSNNSIVTVNGGELMGLTAGNATVTATYAQNKALEAVCTVVVSYEPKIAISNTSAQLKVGTEKLSLSATVRLANGVVNESVTWSSLNSNIASVNNGMVTAHKVGETIIVATSVDVPSISAQCAVSVVSDPSISINKNNILMAVGKTDTLVATVVLSDGTTNSLVNWTTADSTIATVSEDGLVSGLIAGITTITATSISVPTLTATCTVEVAQPKVSLSATQADIILQDEIVTLIATVLLANGDISSLVTWQSSNNSIVTVEGGALTAKQIGTAVITATSIEDNSLVATCQVTVLSPTAVTINKTVATMILGSGVLRLNAQVKYANGVVTNAVEWASADQNILTIRNGIVTPISVGSTTVTASAPANSASISASCVINIVADTTGIDTVTSGNVILTLRNSTENDNLYYSAKATNTEITSAVIPSNHANIPVTEIEDNAFVHCVKLATFTMGENVVNIGSKAFLNTIVLTQAIVLNQNTKMAEYAFSRSYFNKVTISEGTTVVPLAAFEGADLTTVVFPKSLKEIKAYAFASCLKLKVADMTNTSLEMIGTEMVGTKLGNSFYRCGLLENVGKLPNTLKEIGYATFLNCSNLKTITLGNNLRKIGAQAFMQCAKITSLTIPNSVMIIQEGAFNAWGADQTIQFGFYKDEMPIGFHSNFGGNICRAIMLYK